MAVTFTRVVQSAYDAELDSATLVTSTVVGTAMRVRGDPHKYREIGLVESKAPTLFFVPATYGETPEPGDTCTWESETYTARDVDVLAPDGVTISARIIIEK
jgi:hypothetical protein